MNKRQTLSQPNVDGLSYSLLEQKGDQNTYRLTGRLDVNGDLVKVLGTAQEINTYAKDEIVSTQPPKSVVVSEQTVPVKQVTKKETKEVINIAQRVSVAAKGLWNLFLEQKKITPLKKEIEIYRTEEGRAIIDQLLSDASRDEVKSLLGHSLFKALEVYGLSFSTPSLSYFTDAHINHGAWLKMRRLGKDTERESELQKRGSKCAKAMADIYTAKKKEKPLTTEINIYAEPDGKKAIAALLKDVSEENIDIAMLFDNLLRKALVPYGLQLSRPSYDYFFYPENHGGWLKVSTIRKGELVA